MGSFARQEETSTRQEHKQVHTSHLATIRRYSIPAILEQEYTQGLIPLYHLVGAGRRAPNRRRGALQRHLPRHAGGHLHAARCAECAPVMSPAEGNKPLKAGGWI